ncbi:MAG: phospholipid carrier-dependent glycosyltransferase [Gemmataceae bacterium]|nr:phospholipid carrier-dependent glycosyltransferase [Gemmataceae bacterium]
MTRADVAAAAVAAGLVGWFWWQGERFIAANGPTFDEAAHLAAGVTSWATGDFRFNPEDPPLMKWWWAVPAVVGRPPASAAVTAAPDHWRAGNALLYESGVPSADVLTPARRMNLAVGCGVVLVAGWWAYRSRGRLAGLAAAAFAAVDPTLQALACVLSTDVGLAFFAPLTSYLLWEYAGRPARTLLAATGVSLGLLLSTKFSAVGAVAGLVAAGGVYVLRGGVLALPGVTPTREGRGRAAVDLLFRLGVIAAVTLAATYGFAGFGEWGRGLRFQVARSAAGGDFYLLGERSQTGWYHYFLIAVGLKLPVGLLVASLLGGVSPAKSTRSYGWVLLVPVVFFALASYSRVDLGVRVVLPAVVFLYVLAGRLAAPGPYRLPRLVVLAGCLGWAAAAGWRAAPHQLAYLNELAGELPLADSNLDWGQGLPALKAYMDREGIEAVHLAYFGTDRPEAHGLRYHALPGFGRVGLVGGVPIPAAADRCIVVVSATHLAGLYLPDPDLYRRLRDRPPTAVLGGCLFVYDLTDDEEAGRRVRALVTLPLPRRPVGRV